MKYFKTSKFIGWIFFNTPLIANSRALFSGISKNKTKTYETISSKNVKNRNETFLKQKILKLFLWELNIPKGNYLITSLAWLVIVVYFEAIHVSWREQVLSWYGDDVH